MTSRRRGHRRRGYSGIPPFVPSQPRQRKPRPIEAIRYGSDHRKLRLIALANLVPGSPCPQPIDGVVCGKPMWPTQRLHLGHADDGSYLGLVHAVCNERAAAIKGNRQRSPRPPRRPW